MKVYIVQTDFGQYEDARQYITAVYDNLAAAEAHKSRIEDTFKNVPEIGPMPWEEYEEKMDKIKWNPDDMTDELHAYDKWEDEKGQANDFNFAFIKDYEVYSKLN